MAGKDSGHPRMTADLPKGAAEGLREKAQEMASNVGDAAGQMKDRAREFASGIAEQAGESWRSAREGMQENFSGLSHRAEDLWGDVSGMIRRYPIASLAIAFGLGCLASAALSVVPHTDNVPERMSRSSS